jgi:CRP/FNR family transcriptional regulator, anaerobic regulatory protein
MDEDLPLPIDSLSDAQGRLGEFASLSSRERAALAGLLEPVQHWPRHHVLRHEGADPSHIYLLTKGWVASSIALASGKQQIVKVHLPGDLMGEPSLCLTATADCLTAMTPIAVRAISKSRLMATFQTYPRIALSLFLSAQKERVALMESLAVIGQAPAHVRIAATLTHLFDRLSQSGDAPGGIFQMPLTQRDLGDLIGITPVHVNRTLREMDRLNLIKRSDQTIFLLDVDRLRRVAGLPARDYVYRPDWIASVRS